MTLEPNITTGYSCPYCGTWVGSGKYHICNYDHNIPTYWDRQQEIIDLLQQILAELKKR